MSTVSVASPTMISTPSASVAMRASSAPLHSVRASKPKRTSAPKRMASAPAGGGRSAPRGLSSDGIPKADHEHPDHRHHRPHRRQRRPPLPGPRARRARLRLAAGPPERQAAAARRGDLRGRPGPLRGRERRGRRPGGDPAPGRRLSGRRPVHARAVLRHQRQGHLQRASGRLRPGLLAPARDRLQHRRDHAQVPGGRHRGADRHRHAAAGHHRLVRVQQDPHRAPGGPLRPGRGHAGHRVPLRLRVRRGRDGPLPAVPPADLHRSARSELRIRRRGRCSPRCAPPMPASPT